MSDVTSGAGCACCASTQVEQAEAEVGASARALGIGGADLDGLMEVSGRDSCDATRTRMAQLVDARLAAAQAAVVVVVEEAAAVQTRHGGGTPAMPQPVVELHRSAVDRLAVVAQLQAAAAVLAEESPEGACGETCPCVRAGHADAAQAQVRMALAASALDGPAGPDIVCTLDGGLPAMRGRIDEWQAAIGRATGRHAVSGGVALSFEHDAGLTVELARLAAAEFACCSFFEFGLTVGPAGMTFTVRAPEEAMDVVTAVFGTAEPALVGGR